jgi:hypothetical protein
MEAIAGASPAYHHRSRIPNAIAMQEAVDSSASVHEIASSSAIRPADVSVGQGRDSSSLPRSRAPECKTIVVAAAAITCSTPIPFQDLAGFPLLLIAFMLRHQSVHSEKGDVRCAGIYVIPSSSWRCSSWPRG